MRIVRFALYFVPPEADRWAQVAAAWLGWDIVAGRAVAQPDWSGLPRPAEEITRTPRRYGLHATLKPPFRLADGAERAALEEACARLAGSRPPVTLGGLTLGRMGRFAALQPAGEAEALNALAAACVTELDAFRAPPGEEELARRRAARLTERQERNLVHHGYPYVLDDFRFHLTLTGRLPDPDLAGVLDVLDRELAPHLPAPLAIHDIALAGEDEAGRFHLLDRYALAG